MVSYFFISDIYLKNVKKIISKTTIVMHHNKSCQNLWILSHMSELFELPAGCTSVNADIWCGYVTFNERFVQCFAYLSSCLRDLFASDWLTKSSNHTSLNLTNSGLVITTLGPNNSG